MGVAYEREAGGAHVAEAYGQNVPSREGTPVLQ